ncbi:MAG TPA: cobalamin-dependent protein [Steroidobacteraceae bacterium]|nr:cobalamin-dependent protein [Steroidobacteraceae bacterium]
MPGSDPFAAELLEQGASGYAAAAAEQLLGASPGQPEDFGRWKQHFVQRLLELAAAVGSGEPRLFVDRALWTLRAMEARDIPADQTRLGLEALREALVEELPEQAKPVPLACVDAALEAVKVPPPPEPAGLDPDRPTDRLALGYLQRVLEGDVIGAIDRLAESIRNGLSVESAYIDVLMAAQREVGRMWHLDQITIGEEHLVTTTTHRAMAVLASQTPRRPSRGRTAVAAAVAGNPHEIGIRAIAHLFEIDGWRTIYLGNDMPADDLPGVVQFFAADLVLLSCTLSVHLRALRQTVERLRGQRDSAVKIMVGGYVFRDAPDLWRDLGADGYAPDARAALKIAADLAAAQI